MLGWPLSLIAYINSLYLCLQTGIYGKAVLEIIYIIIAIYGFWHWLYGGSNHKRLSVTNLPTKEAHILLCFLIISYFIVANLLATHTDSTIPKLDALTMVLCIVGHWLTSRKYIEAWGFWFITDLFVAALFYHKNLPGHFILNIVYLPVAVYGYYKWRSLKELPSLTHLFST